MDYQKYVDENHIENFLNFMYDHPNIYKKLLLDKSVNLSSIKYKNKRRVLSKINISIQDIQYFIDLIEIENPTAFCKLDSGLYSYCRSNGLLDFINYPNKRSSYKNINTLEDFQKYVEVNNLNNPREFEIFNKSLYTKLIKKNLADKIKYNKRKTNYQGTFDTLELIQKFINDNNIISSIDFKLRFSPYYYKMASLGLCYSVNYVNSNLPNGIQSGWEEEVYFLLKNLGYEVKTQIKYDKLHPLSKIDIEVLKNGKFITYVEIQGEHHFMKRYGSNEKEKIDRFIKTRKYDLNKHRYALKNNRSILYLTFSKYLITKYGFPFYVYTSLEDLVNEIKRLEMEQNKKGES